MKITLQANTPLNRLIFAINHYVSTGDRIGEGIMTPEGAGRVCVTIPVNRQLQEDQSDFACFKSRFEQLASRYHIRLEPMGRDGKFDFWAFRIAEADIDRLADALLEHPGPMGWGSLKELIDMFNWTPWGSRTARRSAQRS